MEEIEEGNEGSEEMRQVGEKEWRELRKKAQLLREASKVVSVEDRDLLRTIERFQKEIEEMRKELKKK